MFSHHGGNAAGNVGGLEEFRGVFLAQAVNFRVWVCLVSTLSLVVSTGRPDLVGAEKFVPGRCLGFRFFLLPHYLFLVIATSEMFTPKLSHN